MEDEERQKKLEAGKAKLAEYRQRKAHADGQKKQKKKKKKRMGVDDSEGDGQGRGEAEQDQSGGGEELDRDRDPPTTEFTFARTLRSGETVKHDQTYTIEPESEMSTTAEDYSSEVNGCPEMTEKPMESSKDVIWEEGVDPLQKEARGGRLQDMEDQLSARTQAVELEEIRAAFGTEGVRQLQDFEAALKQRDGIITQLTANLQQARKEKDETMREFLELTEQSQKLHIQFQQLQAGETLRNTSHSSTAADLLQARQQLFQYQQQVEEMVVQVRGHEERSQEQLLQITQLQHGLNEAHMVGRRTEESFAQRLNEKELLIAEQEKIMLGHEHALKQLKGELSHAGRGLEESFTQRTNERDLLISEQTAIIKGHELSLTRLKEELELVGRRTEESFAQKLHEKDLLIAQQESVVSERDCSLTQLSDELVASERQLNDLNQQMAAKTQELQSCGAELESRMAELGTCRGDLEISWAELETCKGELSSSRQKERMSSTEIQQLMGTVEELQKRNHQGSLSESDTLQRLEEDSARKLEHLRAELDEMYGQQIVQMKQELRSQHSADIDRLTEKHCAELELLRSQQPVPVPGPAPEVVAELNVQMVELRGKLQEAQALHLKARQELNVAAQEKLNLQGQVEDLSQDLRSARAKVEQASQKIASQENRQGELQRFQDAIDDLKAQLAAAEEAAEETEAKHESETTNYKIKLEMMEREKDAVLDRMAESQEAELERLRTQLLFSHEEELSLLREDLQRESHLNAENLLNESAIKQERALEQLRGGLENKLRVLEGERAGFAAQRDELLHQIVALKEDLKLALQSSKAEELVEQLQQLQVEVEELRKEGNKQVGMEKEIQNLLRTNELLENQSKEKEKHWDDKWREQESEKHILKETSNAMKGEVEAQSKRIQFLTTENEQIQQQVVELREEIDKQKTTFSFAEKNFEVNYQELKEEYTCLIEVKAQLEGRILKETLEYEAKLSSLQSQNQQLKENNKTSDTSTEEKDTTELMEKLEVAMKEKHSLTARLSEVTEQLTVTESELEQSEAELRQVRVENEGIVARNKDTERELKREREILKEKESEMERVTLRVAQSEAKLQQAVRLDQAAAPACSIKDHPLQIESLRGEVEVLRSSLQKAEIERDRVRSAAELQRQAATKSLAAVAVRSAGVGPVEGGPSSKPSGSNRRKRRQRGKQDCQSSTHSEERGERKEEEEEEEVPEGDKAGSAAEQEARAQMESRVASPSQQRVREEDSTDGYHGDGVEKQKLEGDGMERETQLEARWREEAGESTEHAECLLQLEAQRISLSQIHAAQLEMLREQTDARACALEQELGRLKEHRGTDEPKALKYQSVVHIVSQECKQLILSFANLFGEEFLEYLYHTDVEDWKTQPVEREEETRDPSSVIQEAKELCRDLHQVKERIEEEHERLLQLQSLLKADGNKIEAMQIVYDELKASSEKELSVLRMQMDSSSPATHKLKDTTERTSAPTIPSECMDRLKAEVQEQQGQLEERHRQETERLRSYYLQQAKDTEQRYATELTLLQQRLQEVTGSEPHFSLSSVAQLTSQREEEAAEELMLVEEELLQVGLDAELSLPVKSIGLTPQLQALRRALCHKYVQEVAALKEQHSAEVRRLREEREQEQRESKRERRRGEGEEREEEEEVLSKRDSEGVSSGGVRSIEGPNVEGQGGVERRHQERVEEEIAKVIVQMSVEFAQQSELALVTKHARETTSAMQTEEEEEDERGEDEQTPGETSKGGSLEEVERRKFTEQKEKLERELKERTAELHRLKKQLRHTGPPPDQKKGEEQEREERDEEEVERKRALGENVSSQDGGESATPDVITTERNLLRKANESLRQVLCDVLKTTAAAEETIGRHVEGLLEASSRGKHPSSQRPTWQRAPTEPFRPYGGHADGTTESCQSSETGTDDISVWSAEMETDEGLEMSQQTTDCLLPGPELQLENEEYLMNISTRLQAAVEKLLVAITETTNQLEHARLTQTELMRESFRHNQEMGELQERQEELQERLGEEARARERLALELHRAEGVIDGYTGERAALEDQLRLKEEVHLTLEQELQVTSSRLHELEQERLQMLEERELLSRQQDAMREVAGPRELCLVEAAVVAAPEADLLEETEKLMKEKVEVQRQAEKESMGLLKQVKLLEAELEEQVNRVIELEHAQKTESGDLRQQIQALEKQLEKNRKFLDEQAIDREHERDVFQQEILKLELQLKNPQKLLSGSEQRSREVDQLTSQLKEKADWCSELLLGSEQLQREAGERNEEIDKLEGRVRQLEQALLASTETLEKTEEKRQHVTVTEAGGSSLEAQLQTEREALDRKEKEISNLEEQLEQFREELENKSEEVQQLQMQLEIQGKELSTQQYDQATKDNLLRVMEAKESEIALLNEQIAKLRHTKTASDNKELDGDKDELIRDLESQVECMRSEQERLKRNGEEELDQLNAVIDKLQQELANIEQKQAAEDEEDPKGQPESKADGPGQERYDEMKQRMDMATKELDTLKSEHGSLLDTYRRLKESAVALAETEQLEEDSAVELEEALREKTAGFVVMQAQVQALEHSAATRVEDLSCRVQELEDLVGERDSELARCRFLVEKAQEDAEELQRKVSSLEDKLRERVAAALVSQAQLGAVQQQSQGAKDQRTKEPGVDTRDQMDAPAHDFGLLGMPQLDFSVLSQARRGPTGKVVLLTEKLRELEVGLSGMQKDQELQKQLLSSSEEEVLEYERRLAVLMDLLNQMRTKPSGHQRKIPFTEVSSGNETSLSEVLQELHEVRDEAAATREQLRTSQESSRRLQAELKAKEILISKLQEDLHRVSSRGVGEAAVSDIHGELREVQEELREVQEELREVQEEAAATKEELGSSREHCDKLQQMLQEREMTIAHLKGELYQASSEGEGADRAELLQDLQEVREEASAAKEQLNSFRESTEKLQDQLQIRDLSIAQLQEELQQLRTALATAMEPPLPSPSPQLSSSASSSSSQPKKKGGKQQGGKGGTAKEKPSLVRKNSAAASQSSDKPRTPSLNGGSQQSVPRADVASQTEPSQTEPSQASGLRLGTRSASEEEEEVQEVIGEYQEKIAQMQELHAAEIMDMEARHIAESEALRRDGHLLEEECKALRAAIDKLRSSEAPSSRPERPAASQFKDGYASDSSSDWSQRTGYDLPNLQQEFRTTPEGARRETDDALPDRIKVLLREVHQEGMQVLNLSELPLAEGEADPAILIHAQGSAKEREALVATVESLKSLITQMQTHRETQTSGGADWRAELLAAVQQVFVRERSVLKSALYARLDLLDTSDAVVHLNQLERRLAEQDSHHREAMGNLHAADRSSLISEIRQLRVQLEHVQTLDLSQRTLSSQGVQPGVQEQRERLLPQAVAGGPQDPHTLQAERALLEELKAELTQTKLELETTLKAQHKHLQELDTLRAEVSQKAAEVDTLTDRLSEEQKTTREHQWALEKERSRSDRKEETEREALEDLKLTLEEHQSRVAQLTSALDQERQASSQLSLQTQQEHLGLQSRLSELQVQLGAERARAQELDHALGREKELRRGASRGGGGAANEGEEGNGGEVAEGGVRSFEAVLEGLQRELDEKHAKVVGLLSEVETQKLEAVRREEELTSTGQRSRQDQEALREARARLEVLEERAQEAKAQLDREEQRRKGLEQEKERLEERLARLGEMREEERARSGTQRADSQNQAAWRGEPTDRTRDWVFQQKSSDAHTANSGTPSLLEGAGRGNTTAHDPRPATDSIMVKLHLIATQIRTMASKGTGRLTTEEDREGLSWLQSNIDEVINMLQQSPGLPSVPESVPQSGAVLAGGSSSLTERLLRQNAELTGFVSRLTEEKNDLRNQTLRLEEELRRYRQAGLSSGDSSGSRRGVDKLEATGTLFSQEREAWSRERSQLEKALRLAQAELARLRGEIRTESLRDMAGPEADNATLKRMYGKYLRSESFRKALIYQKKYLLLLLGGFQECEEATLSLIVRMGGRPSNASLESLTHRRRGLTRFRSAVRVSIALSRMRFLVKRWQKATGMGFTPSGTVNRNGLTQTPGSEVRDAPYLQPASLEVYGERRGGANRGRSGRDSPRSALSSAQHRFHMVGEHGGLTCSHLQNYDPDRALTDYISRLEALQRRLGSVTSGSSSYAQLHFGMRR